MNEYQEVEDKQGITPENYLRALKAERYAYQQMIDKAIKDLAEWTEKKNSTHFGINRIKRIIREKAVH